jgi:hypothetical protein
VWEEEGECVSAEIPLLLQSPPYPKRMWQSYERLKCSDHTNNKEKKIWEREACEREKRRRRGGKREGERGRERVWMHVCVLPAWWAERAQLRHSSLFPAFVILRRISVSEKENSEKYATKT